MRFLLADLTLDGYMPGLRVCKDCYDTRQPQEFPISLSDPQALWKAAPDSVQFTASVLSVTRTTRPPIIAWTEANFEAYTVGSYQIYRSTDGANFTLLSTITITRDLVTGVITPHKSYIDGTAAATTLYYYKVTAVSAAANSVYAKRIDSNIISFTTGP